MPEGETDMLDGSLDVHATLVVTSLVDPSDIAAVAVSAVVAPTTVSTAFPVTRIDTTDATGAGVVGAGEGSDGVGVGAGAGLAWSQPAQPSSAAISTMASERGFIRR